MRPAFNDQGGLSTVNLGRGLLGAIAQTGGDEVIPMAICQTSKAILYRGSPGTREQAHAWMTGLRKSIKDMKGPTT